MNILVTGGAGYIGSIVAEELLKQGDTVIILDSLEQGHREAVPENAEFVVADVRQIKTLDKVFRQTRIDAVMHMAAETLVEYSMTDPKRYFQNNINGGTNLLDTMLKYNVSKFVFSSTAAVYGEPQDVPIQEEHPKIPLNAYGESKLMFERILHWYGHAYGIKHISLRYFNAAGASEQLGEDHYPETHLIPNVLKAALNGHKPVDIFGSDYSTKDGSCIRDYVHVLDIAQAHILALGKVEELSGRFYNLGNSHGYSVFEVMDIAKRVAKSNIPTRICPRRAGDPSILIASADKAKSELLWQPRFPELETIIDSAWQWMRRHPKGYKD